jgi:hypothetical protein
MAHGGYEKKYPDAAPPGPSQKVDHLLSACPRCASPTWSRGLPCRGVQDLRSCPPASARFNATNQPDDGRSQDRTRAGREPVPGPDMSPGRSGGRDSGAHQRAPASAAGSTRDTAPKAPRLDLRPALPPRSSVPCALSTRSIRWSIYSPRSAPDEEFSVEPSHFSTVAGSVRSHGRRRTGTLLGRFYPPHSLGRGPAPDRL